MKPVHAIRVTYEKILAGDALSDGELAEALQHFTQLETLLSPLGPRFAFAFSEVTRVASELARFQDNRHQAKSPFEKLKEVQDTRKATSKERAALALENPLREVALALAAEVGNLDQPGKSWDTPGGVVPGRVLNMVDDIRRIANGGEAYNEWREPKEKE